MFAGKEVLNLNFKNLKITEALNYTGEIIIMRDAAQKRISELILNGEEVPIDLNGKIVFYAGPAKKKDGDACGAIGPTTSERMDKFLEMLFKLGVVATIGKGARTDVARDLCRKYERVYFVTPSGSAASLSKKIKKHEVLLYEELGTEAIQKIYVEDFPLMVAIDSCGKDFFLKE